MYPRALAWERRSQATETYLSLHIRFRLDPDFRHAFVKRIQVFDIVVLCRYPGDNLYDFWGRYGGILGWSGRDHRTQAIARNPRHRGDGIQNECRGVASPAEAGTHSAATRRWCRYRSSQTNCGARKDK